jgi:hypothetical protein
MADKLLVLNGPLCYLLNQFSKIDQRQLKSTLLNFFRPNEIADAKDLLFYHVSKLPANDVQLKNTKRRDSNGRSAKEIDDVFTALSVLDENKLLTQLPTFVTDDPSSLPSANIGEGDMKAIMNRFEKMESLINQLQGCMNKSMSAIKPPVFLNRPGLPVYNTSTNVNVDGCSSASTKPGLHNAGRVVNKPEVVNERSLPLLSSDDKQVNKLWSENYVSTDSVSCDDVEGEWETASSRKRRRRTKSNKPCDSPMAVQNSDFPPLVQSAGHSRVQRLASSVSVAVNADRSKNYQDSCHDKSSTGAGRLSYGMVAAAPPTKNSVASTIASTIKQSGSQRSSSRVEPLLIGKKKSQNSEISAANPYVSKSVFCIDNIATNVSTSDMCEFVKKLGVTVLSCHLVKPRRTRWQQEQDIWPARSTFRLCIPREETDKFLIAEAWPDHVAISAWRFLKKAPTQGVLKVPDSRATKDRINAVINQLPPSSSPSSSKPASSISTAAKITSLTDVIIDPVVSLPPLLPLSSDDGTEFLDSIDDDVDNLNQSMNVTITETVLIDKNG